MTIWALPAAGLSAIRLQALRSRPVSAAIPNAKTTTQPLPDSKLLPDEIGQNMKDRAVGKGIGLALKR